MDITPQQVNGFAGNVLEVRTAEDTPCIAMSSAAYHAFTTEQRAALDRCAPLIAHAPIPTIERLGGGSVRCMLAEVFLPPNALLTMVTVAPQRLDAHLLQSIAVLVRSKRPLVRPGPASGSIQRSERRGREFAG